MNRCPAPVMSRLVPSAAATSCSCLRRRIDSSAPRRVSGGVPGGEGGSEVGGELVHTDVQTDGGCECGHDELELQYVDGHIVEGIDGAVMKIFGAPAGAPACERLWKVRPVGNPPSVPTLPHASW